MRCFLTAVLISALSAAAGCEAFDASLLNPPDSGPSCDLERPPARPDPDLVPDGDDGVTYFWAARELLIDQNDDRWRTSGYDLDGLCSEAPDFEVECRAPSPSAPAEEDGVRGTDNSLGHNIVPIITVAFPDIQEELRGFQTQGTGVTLIQVTGWNGEDEDPRVEAVLSQSIFGTSADPGEFDEWSIEGAMLTIDGEEWPLPNWDGNDLWWARDDNYLDGNPEQPRVRDDNAWISERTLVMRLPDRFPIIYGGDMRATQFLLTDAVATAKIADDDQSLEELVIAGRFSVLDLLSTLGSAGGCPGTSDYESFERLLELAADIRAEPGSGGPGTFCNAVSVGLLYESGVRASFGGIAEGTTIPDPCTMPPDAGMDGGTMDGGTMDTGTPDTGTPDTSTPDTGAPDTGAPDTGTPDAGMDGATPTDAAGD